jgi:hypothetical protein
VRRPQHFSRSVEATMVPAGAQYSAKSTIPSSSTRHWLTCRRQLSPCATRCTALSHAAVQLADAKAFSIPQK